MTWLRSLLAYGTRYPVIREVHFWAMNDLA